ncbi:DUF2846 domain-containing protein [Curvibacter lanceolatus]|uniref:DUF2846 domain-containing protein n=1 Tax=Curvibacter lanceolatus TaxID=86182 RepID=UPI000A00608D
MWSCPSRWGGCGAYGPAFSESKAPSPSLGAVYLYRLPAFAAGGLTPPILIDGVKVAVMKNGGYLRRELTPGHHTVVVQSAQPTGVDINIEPGKTLYFRYTMELRSSGLYTVPGSVVRSLDNIPPEVALVELQETKALE